MNYEHLDQFDLLKEAFFVEWVKNPTEMSNSYWQGWIDNNPDKKEIVEEVIKLINSIDYQHELGWKDGLLIFRSADQSDVIKK